VSGFLAERRKINLFFFYGLFNGSGSGDMSIFERYLTIWVALCIVVGIALGQMAPNVFEFAGRIEVAHINLPVAVLVWLMIIPMLIKIDLKQLRLAWFFIGFLFRDYLPAEQIDSYVAGLVILAAAPCTAMVFVWSHLMRGEPHFTLSSLERRNHGVCFCAYRCVVTGIVRDHRALGYAAAVSNSLHRYTANHRKPVAQKCTESRKWSGAARSAYRSPGPDVSWRVVLIQVFFNSGLAYLLNRLLRSPHCVAGPSALIGASNFFELAVATAIALFGFESGAALATVVGVLIEVPVMLLAVRVVNQSRGWYERRVGIVPIS
jgi:ACR3 family arsenite transporter